MDSDLNSSAGPSRKKEPQNDLKEIRNFLNGKFLDTLKIRQKNMEFDEIAKRSEKIEEQAKQAIQNREEEREEEETRYYDKIKEDKRIRRANILKYILYGKVPLKEALVNFREAEHQKIFRCLELRVGKAYFINFINKNVIAYFVGFSQIKDLQTFEIITLKNYVKVINFEPVEYDDSITDQVRQIAPVSMLTADKFHLNLSDNRISSSIINHELHYGTIGLFRIIYEKKGETDWTTNDDFKKGENDSTSVKTFVNIVIQEIVEKDESVMSGLSTLKFSSPESKFHHLDDNYSKMWQNYSPSEYFDDVVVKASKIFYNNALRPLGSVMPVIEELTGVTLLDNDTIYKQFEKYRKLQKPKESIVQVKGVESNVPVVDVGLSPPDAVMNEVDGGSKKRSKKYRSKTCKTNAPQLHYQRGSRKSKTYKSYSSSVKNATRNNRRKKRRSSKIYT